jgi:DNA-binding beta-propeller fold protein YncE
MKRHSLKLFFGAIALSVFCLGFSCNKSIEPVEPKDYPFYLTDAGNDQIFVFHPTTQQLDSMSVPWGVGAAVTVSADGKLLYVALGSSVLVVDAKSLSTVDEILYPHTQPVAVSPDNKLIAIFGSELYILKTSDYSLIFKDTAEFEYKSGVFSSDSRTFYCASTMDFSSLHGVFKVNLSDSLFPIIKRGFTTGAVTQVVPSIDESKWFLYLSVGLWTYSFEVYDTVLDSIIFEDVLVPGAGYLAMSPDGRYVYYTSPGRTATDPPSDMSIKTFELSKNEIKDTINCDEYCVFSTGFGPPAQLAVSPDGRWLGILGGQMSIYVFILYDLATEKFVYRTVTNGMPQYIKGFSIQNSK